MLKTYVMIENSHMLSIINQINQLFDENTKIVKIDTNIELLTMQIKLNMIIKNQSKSVIKFETTFFFYFFIYLLSVCNLYRLWH